MIARFPEYTAENTLKLEDYLGKLGLVKEEPNTNIQITQIAKIKVDKTGTEAAAVTEIIKDNAVTEVRPYKNISFNKPFYYAIYDNINDDFAFVGQVTTVNQP